MHASPNDERDAKQARTRVLLDAWEQGGSERPAERALTLLHAGGGAGRRDLARLSVGRRDRALLELRQALFGARVCALTACPACAETVDLEFELDAIVVAESAGTEAPATVDVAVAGQTLRVRVPTAGDLSAAGYQPSIRSGRVALLNALLVEGPDGPPPAAEDLPDDAIGQIGEALAAADPQADVSLSACCPSCATRWDCGFDVGAFVWSELDDWATRLLWDIQTLAAAYGWRETDALALSPARRRFYVEAAHA